MLTGACPGAGKSTAMRALSTELEARVVTEDDVWGERVLDESDVTTAAASPVFARLIHDRTSPATAEEFATAFEEVVSADNVTVQDWAWFELVAIAVAPNEWGRAIELIKVRSEPLSPMLIFLDVEPGIGVSRALNERGDVWFRRHAYGLGIEGATTVQLHELVADHYRKMKTTRLKWLRDADPNLRIVDASRDATEVFTVVRSLVGAA